MGRYTGASCRQCRREGTKLFLKATKCFTEKCPVERRPYAPGQHGQATVYRMGFAGSRKAARQLIRHRHVEVNQKSVDIPSFQVQPGQEVRLRVKSREQVSVLTAMDQSSRGAPLSWIAVDKETFSGRVLEKPARTSIPIAAQEQLVVELYSK